MKESTVVALFDEFEDAKGALSDLMLAGIARDKIALLANGASSHHPASCFLFWSRRKPLSILKHTKSLTNLAATLPGSG